MHISIYIKHVFVHYAHLNVLSRKTLYHKSKKYASISAFSQKRMHIFINYELYYLINNQIDFTDLRLIMSPAILMSLSSPSISSFSIIRIRRITASYPIFSSGSSIVDNVG